MTTEHPWRPGETHRYTPCGRHAGALSRMDFWTAYDYAASCSECITEERAA